MVSEWLIPEYNTHTVKNPHVSYLFILPVISSFSYSVRLFRCLASYSVFPCSLRAMLWLLLNLLDLCYQVIGHILLKNTK